MIAAHRRSGGWSFAAALVLSGVVHLLLLGIRFELPLAQSITAKSAGAIAAVPAMQVIDFVPVDDAIPVAAVEVTPRPRAQQVSVPPRTTGRQAAVAAPDPDHAPASVTDRLTPKSGDSRLWDRGVEPLRPTFEPLDGVHARIGAPVEAYNDSVAAAAEASRRAADWTQTDSAGARWGISPDTVHLGSRTFVLRKCSAGPCPGYLFTPRADRKDEQADWMRVFDETRQQVLRAEVEEAFQGRVRAIRMRNAAARDTTTSRM